MTSVNFNKKKYPKLLEIGSSYGKIVRDLANNFFGISWHLYHPYCYTINSLGELLNQTNFLINKSYTSGRPHIILGNYNLSVIASKNLEKNIYKNTKKRFPFLKIKIGIILSYILRKSLLRKLNKSLEIITGKYLKRNLIYLYTSIKKLFKIIGL